MYDLKSISKSLQDAAKEILEAKKDNQVDEASDFYNRPPRSKDHKVMLKYHNSEAQRSAHAHDAAGYTRHINKAIHHAQSMGLSYKVTPWGLKMEAVDEAKKPLHPNQQKLDVHEPEKDELTAKDFEMLRAGKKAKMKEEVEDSLAEAEVHALHPDPDKPDHMVHITDVKHSSDFHKRWDKEPAKSHKEFGYDSPIVKKSSPDFKHMTKHKMTYDQYSSLVKHHSLKENIDQIEDADETILVHTPVEFELNESYMFGDYLVAAKAIVGEEHAIELANYAFNKQDTSLFIEQFMRSDIESKIATHRKMGHKVSEPKYSTKSGKSYAEYVVTDKEGVRRKYIHHGSNRKTENMGPVGKRDEE